MFFLFIERCQEDIFERFTYRDNYNEEQISRVVAQVASALHWIHFKGYDFISQVEWMEWCFISVKIIIFMIILLNQFGNNLYRLFYLII